MPEAADSINFVRLVGRVKNPSYRSGATGYTWCYFELQTLDIKTAPIPCIAWGEAAQKMRSLDNGRKLAGRIWECLGEVHAARWKERRTQEPGARFEIRIHTITNQEN